jgi:hypothetical protein
MDSGLKAGEGVRGPHHLFRSAWDEKHRCVSVYVTNEQYEGLRLLAKKHQITVSAYFRSIVTDALLEDLESQELSDT